MTTATTSKRSPESGKEEGELSVSDDEGRPIHSVAMQTSTDTPLAGNASGPLAKKQIQGRQTGITGSINRSADAVLLKRPGNQKTEKKHVTCSTTSKRKSVPVRDDKNLVISFSDDDSCSDSDIKGRTETLKNQPKVVSMSGSRNWGVLSLAKSKGPSQVDRSLKKGFAKNASWTRTFSPAVNSKVANLSMAKGSDSRKFVPVPGRKLSKEKQNSNDSVDLNSYKLQDLRQQIALRESELKLKTAKLVKDAVNQNIGSARRLNVLSADVKLSEPKEPAKKRLKVSGIESAPPVLGYRMPVADAIAMKEPCVKESQLPDSDANAGCKDLSKSCDPTDHHAVSQRIVEGDTSSNILQKSAVGNDYSGAICGQPNVALHLTSRQPGIVMNTDCDGAMSSGILLKTSDGKHQPSLENSDLCNVLGTTSVPGQSQLDIQALTNMEEHLDKELEEAQEYRRICEIEERKALKVYRKAQRSLIEANARCAELYHKRETCSALFGSLMRDPSVLWPSRYQKHTEIGFGLLNNSTENIDMGTKSNLPQFIQQEHNRAIDNVNGGQRVPSSNSGMNLGSEPCSDPDASTSDRLPNTHKLTISRLCSPSSDANISPDNDGSYPANHEFSQNHHEGQQQGTHEETRQICSDGGNQSSLLLEAALRSKLFERLGIKADSTGVGTCSNEEASIDKGTESDAASEKTQIDGGVPVSENYQQNDFGGSKMIERHPVKDNSLIYHSTEDLESTGTDFLSASAAMPCFLSTLSHLKVSGFPIALSEPEHTLQNKSYSLRTGEMQCSSFVEISSCARKIGLYKSDVSVNPSWPLCMYELRGRCNNDECPWQHLKDFSHDDMHQTQHDNTDAHQRKSNTAIGSQVADLMPSPTYHVCLDTIKANSSTYEPVIAPRREQSWWKYFSICLASSNSLRKDISAENQGRIEVLGNLRTRSSYFRSKHSLMMNQLKQVSNAAVDPLEVALLTFSQDIDEPDALIQALSLLSRCLEADPTSEILWIVYLLIYHTCERSEAEDDMYSYAVKHSRRSYPLWLMYINSRRQLNDQLLACEDALLALCQNVSASDIDRTYASACILDVFLQMLNLCCISGNVSEAIQRIHKFLDQTAVPDYPHFLMLSDNLKCLTLSDKCVFWVCCVYLVIYRKLPDSILLRLEMEKDLLLVEWPPVDMANDHKQTALKLFEKGEQSIKLCSRGERSTQLFALSHCRFLMAIKELEKCSDLLKKYIKLYPACLELKLLAARIQPNNTNHMFEELVENQSGEASGTQCIWNQYAEFALQRGRHAFTRELMVRWDKSLSCKNQTVLIEDDVVLHGSPKPFSSDVMFGYLNLSLHSLLQNNHDEANLAIDKALKATTPENFMHCLKEHAVFQLIKMSRTKDGFPISLQLRLLKSYMDQANTYLLQEPLSWTFISNCENPRVRKLVSVLLTPNVTSELYVVNTVLEAWYGPSLLPKKPRNPKDLVGFVESVLELAPSNYRLALSVSTMLKNEWKDSSIWSSGIHFWASSNLVNTITCSVPIPPEYIWAEAGDILTTTDGFQTRAESFLTKALSVYPLSVKLLKCYISLSKSRGNTQALEEKARAKDIMLD